MDKNIEDLVKTTTRGTLILLVGQISSTIILAAGMLLVARFLARAHVDETQFDMLRLFVDRLNGSMEVVSCVDPFEAVNLLIGNGFDCVISDYMMPEMNGVELVKRVKALKDIPCILFTGQGSEEVA